MFRSDRLGPDKLEDELPYNPVKDKFRSFESPGMIRVSFYLVKIP